MAWEQQASKCRIADEAGSHADVTKEVDLAASYLSKPTSDGSCEVR
jgi:hypothetical protein